MVAELILRDLLKVRDNSPRKIGAIDEVKQISPELGMGIHRIFSVGIAQEKLTSRGAGIVSIVFGVGEVAEAGLRNGPSLE